MVPCYEIVMSIETLLDHITDDTKRARLKRFLLTRYVAIIGYIVFLITLVLYFIPPLDTKEVNFLGHFIEIGWQIIFLVVMGAAHGVLLLYTSRKSLYPVVNNDGEAPQLQAKIDELRKQSEIRQKEDERKIVAAEDALRIAKEAKKNSEDVFTKRLDDLQAEIMKPRLLVVSWPGYTEQQSLIHFSDFKVLPITYVRGIDRATRFRVESELPDILIVDIELYELAAENVPLCRVDSYAFHPHAQRISKCVKELQGIHTTDHFLPLRMGMNALAYSKIRWGKTVPEDYNVLFDANKCPKGADCIGIWNWYLPTMSILFLAMGKRMEDISAFTFEETVTLLAELTEFLKICNFQRRISAFYNHVDGLINDLESGLVSLVPAGGGWAFRPKGPRGTQQDLVDCVVPPAGAFVWIEGAVVVDKGAIRNQWSTQFLCRLLEDDAQESICLNGPYGGCAVVQSAINRIAVDPDFVRRTDSDNIFDNTRTRLDTNRFRRQLPKQYKQWEEWWDRFVIDCCHNHGAKLK